MRNTIRMTIGLALAVILLTGAMVMAGTGSVRGWILAGNDAQGYVIGTTTEGGASFAFIKSKEPQPNKFGTLMQSFLPTKYQGKRVRLTARIKTVDVENWVGMWLRVDADGKTVSFDNMMDRSIDGTTDWQEYAIVLAVPDVCDNMSLGLILAGSGMAYWDDLNLEIVGNDVPLTGSVSPLPKKGPVNLNFED